jgi:HAE1 family hydrophobic/amphiphilic exporter-1
VEALARLATRRPVAVCVLAAAVVVLGWLAWRDLPLDLLPDVQSPTILIALRSGDRPPAEMERIYSEQLEQRLFAVRGIREIEQVARTGRIVATVGFDWDTEMDFALVEVEKAVGPIRSDVDVDEVVVRRFDPRQSPVVVLGLVAAPEGGPDLAELRQLARRQVATALERLPGVAEVRVTGGREKELRVLVDHYALDAHGVTLGELERRLREANVDINAGTLEEGSRVYIVRGLSRFRRPEDVQAVVVRYALDPEGRRVPVRVSDLARVEFADREIRHLVRVDGREGVGLSIYKEADSNTVAVSRTVREALAGLDADLPDVDVLLVSDEAALVEGSIAEVESAALVGLVLAVLVLVVFLRAAGPTVIVSVAVPVSLLATLFFMHLAGLSLNVMTLGGLALGAGMLVDNTIVVVESVFRKLGAGAPVDEAAVSGTSEVATSIAASTLTICAVFVPILFVRGLASRLVGGLAFAVVVSLVTSVFVAVLLIPALARWLLPRGRARAVDPGIAFVEGLVTRVVRRPVAVVLVAGLVCAGAVLALRALGSELLPPTDPRQFTVRLVGPPGQRVEATARIVEAVEELLRETAGGDLRAMLAEVGRLPEDDRLIHEEQNEENTARLIVRLADGGMTGNRLVARVAPLVDSFDSVEAAWEVGGSALARALGTSGPPIAVEVFGQSVEDLRGAVERLQQALAARPELWNVRSSFEGGPPELRVALDRTVADGLGVDLDTIGTALEASLDGRKATVLTLGDEERDVMLMLPRLRREELLGLRLTSDTGRQVTLGDVARLVPESGAREIYRRDQQRVGRVTARIAADSDYPAALAATRRALAECDLAPGLRARVAGEEEERVRAAGELRWAAAMAVLLVFMVLAGTFESLVHPLTVVSAVPLALVGVAVMLGLVGRPIGVMEMLGMIVLAGVAVNDSILLIDTARRLMADGLDRRRALARAASMRLRPILMTLSSSVLALLPLAFGTDEAARLRSPLALTIVGGLVAATVGTLVVVPCIYDLLDRLRPAARRP